MRTGGIPDRVMALFLDRQGDWVTLREILDAAYGHREDGGPIHAKCCVRQTLHRMRNAGIRIECATVYRIPPRRDKQEPPP